MALDKEEIQTSREQKDEECVMCTYTIGYHGAVRKEEKSHFQQNGWDWMVSHKAKLISGGMGKLQMILLFSDYYILIFSDISRNQAME